MRSMQRTICDLISRNWILRTNLVFQAALGGAEFEIAPLRAALGIRHPGETIFRITWRAQSRKTRMQKVAKHTSLHSHFKLRLRGLYRSIRRLFGAIGLVASGGGLGICVSLFYFNWLTCLYVLYLLFESFFYCFHLLYTKLYLSWAIFLQFLYFYPLLFVLGTSTFSRRDETSYILSFLRGFTLNSLICLSYLSYTHSFWFPCLLVLYFLLYIVFTLILDLHFKEESFFLDFLLFCIVRSLHYSRFCI